MQVTVLRITAWHLTSPCQVHLKQQANFQTELGGHMLAATTADKEQSWSDPQNKVLEVPLEEN